MTHIELINLMKDKIADARAFSNLDLNQELVLSGLNYSLLVLEAALKEGNPDYAISELDEYFKILGIEED